MRRAVSVAAAVVAALAAVAAVLQLATWFATEGPGPANQPPSMADVGGPFRLAASNGGTLDSASLAGKPFAVFFGYTHCPEVCPTTLYELSSALEHLGEEARDLRVFFVTVDPERDTVAFLRDYLANFDPRIVALTGTPEETAAVAKAYRAYYEKVPTGDGDYTMNHTASVFLMGRDGRFFGSLGYGEDREIRLQKLRRLIRER
jgi:protein SCO1/2